MDLQRWDRAKELVGNTFELTVLIQKRCRELVKGKLPAPTWVATDRERVGRGDYSLATPAALQAKAKALSASVKIKPPWQLWCPLSISARMAIDMLARPGPTALIVMPTSLIPNWQDEAARFAPSLKVLLLQGKERMDLFDQIKTTMPDDNPGGLSVQQYTDVVAYIFKINGMPAAITATRAQSGSSVVDVSVVAYQWAPGIRSSRRRTSCDLRFGVFLD